MKYPCISVIVPIYNVQDYLCTCIDSIRNQTYKNIEIILVDDGSSDNCGTICDNYATKDCRIKVFHKTNGGLSDARNYGIDKANGEYIAFVDSDDWISETMYEHMILNALKNNADIVVCGHNIIDHNEKKSIIKVEKEKTYDRLNAMKLLLCDDIIFSFAWDKLYKRDLWNGIKYPVGRIYEDTATTYKIFNKAKIISQIPEALYNYRRNENSICLNKDINKLLKRVHDNFFAFYERYEYVYNSKELNCITSKCASLALKMGLNALSVSIKYSQSNNEYRKMLASISLKGIEFSFKLRIFLIKYCFPIYKMAVLIKN